MKRAKLIMAWTGFIFVSIGAGIATFCVIANHLDFAALAVFLFSMSEFNKRLRK